MGTVFAESLVTIPIGLPANAAAYRAGFRRTPHDRFVATSRILLGSRGVRLGRLRVGNQMYYLKIGV